MTILVIVVFCTCIHSWFRPVHKWSHIKVQGGGAAVGVWLQDYKLMIGLVFALEVLCTQNYMFNFGEPILVSSFCLTQCLVKSCSSLFNLIFHSFSFSFLGCFTQSVCVFVVWSCPSLPLRELGTFSPFKLLAFVVGNLFIKMKSYLLEML